MISMEQAAKGLYETFSPYRVGDDFVGCDCCVSAGESTKLASKPLNLLTYDDLEHYSRSAMSTSGNVRHFKHFLPRLMELAIDHRDDFLDLAVVFGKLRYARWQSWSPREVDAVSVYLRDYWRYQLSLDIENPYSDAIDTVLCAEAAALDSIQHLLAAWLATDSTVARKHLAAFILSNDEELLRKQRLSNAFWDFGATPHGEVLEWLKSPEVSGYLRDAKLPTEFRAATHQLEAVCAALEEART